MYATLLRSGSGGTDFCRRSLVRTRDWTVVNRSPSLPVLSWTHGRMFWFFRKGFVDCRLHSIDDVDECRGSPDLCSAFWGRFHA